ncbi:uncharacterized protein LOC62_06G008023 [Vanrija pseudolonga]|uniref:Extracellular membrane protein CFEM domain-containing protein n=1 Tax=Vanrija pseudolonga TaxID=143232 RepID=A0AAF0YIC9_9TREE|nr:hypothetical protein LOC62_06G008023 [Vanrija pseudolonga]
MLRSTLLFALLAASANAAALSHQTPSLLARQAGSCANECQKSSQAQWNADGTCPPATKDALQACYDCVKAAPGADPKTIEGAKVNLDMCADGGKGLASSMLGDFASVTSSILADASSIQSETSAAISSLNASGDVKPTTTVVGAAESSAAGNAAGAPGAHSSGASGSAASGSHASGAAASPIAGGKPSSAGALSVSLGAVVGAVSVGYAFF